MPNLKAGVRMPRPDRARTANEGIPLQIVDRTTSVASAIGVHGHKKPHVIEAERLGEGLGHRGGAKRRPGLSGPVALEATVCFRVPPRAPKPTERGRLP